METAAYALLTALYAGLPLLAYRWGVRQGKAQTARRPEAGPNGPAPRLTEEEQAALRRQRRIDNFRG